MENILIRKAGIPDIDALVSLRKAQLKQEGAEDGRDISNSLRGFFRAHLKDGTYLSWVALLGDEIVAVSGVTFYQIPPYYQLETGHIGEVASVYTREGYRRKGIASALLRKVFEEAKRRGVTTLRVSASREGRFLYESLGFCRQGNMFVYQVR
ncbi:MAG TPA: N-acetyltransferase [Clostridiales bacterium]|nr:N-acetyltransferase [Clostridiales bacterium]